MLNKKMDRILFTTTIILFFSPVLVYPQNFIRWESIPNVAYYRVNFRQNNEIVYSTQTEESELLLTLSPGNYEFQVEVIDALENVVSVTDWIPLKVIPTDIPFMRDVFPARIPVNWDTTITVQVISYIKNVTTFYLQNGRTRVELDIIDSKTIDDAESDQTEITLNPVSNLMKTGKWDLIAENPREKKFVIDDAITVFPKRKPKIQSVYPDSFETQQKNNHVTIKVNFIDQYYEPSTITIDGPSDLKATLVEIFEDGTYYFNLDLNDAKPGWYSISVKNPIGYKNFKKYGFRIVPSPEDAIAQLESSPASSQETEPNKENNPPPQKQEKLKMDYRPPYPLPPFFHAISLAYTLSIPIVNDLNIFNTSLLGFKIQYSQLFVNQFIRRIKFLKGLSWDINFLFIPGKRNGLIIGQIDLYHISALIGASLVATYNFPVKFVFKIALGMAYTLNTTDLISRDDDIGGFSIAQLDSLDFAWNVGAGIRFEFGKRFYLDLMADVFSIIYTKQILIYFQPQANVAFRW